MSIWFFGEGREVHEGWVRNLLFVPEVFSIFFPFGFSESPSVWTLNGLFQSDNFSLSSALGNYLELFLWLLNLLFFLYSFSGIPIRCTMALLDLSSVFLSVFPLPFFEVMLYFLGGFYNCTFILVPLFGAGFFSPLNMRHLYLSIYIYE